MGRPTGAALLVLLCPPALRQVIRAAGNRRPFLGLGLGDLRFRLGVIWFLPGGFPGGLVPVICGGAKTRDVRMTRLGCLEVEWNCRSGINQKTSQKMKSTSELTEGAYTLSCVDLEVSFDARKGWKEHASRKGYSSRKVHDSRKVEEAGVDNLQVRPLSSCLAFQPGGSCG